MLLFQVVEENETLLSFAFLLKKQQSFASSTITQHQVARTVAKWHHRLTMITSLVLRTLECCLLTSTSPFFQGLMCWSYCVYWLFVFVGRTAALWGRYYCIISTAELETHEHAIGSDSLSNALCLSQYFLSTRWLLSMLETTLIFRYCICVWLWVAVVVVPHSGNSFLVVLW